MTNVLDLKNAETLPESPAEPVMAKELPARLGSGPEDLMARVLGELAEPEPEAMEWEARHTLNERGQYRHYLALAGFALVGGGVSFWQSSWSTLLTIMLGLAAWELHERLGKPVKVRLDERGVAINGRHYPHASLSSFDLHKMADGAVELSLATKHWHSPVLRLPLGATDPEKVRTALVYYVAEEFHPIPLVDRLIRRD